LALKNLPENQLVNRANYELELSKLKQ
jgi:hypothetical protein